MKDFPPFSYIFHLFSGSTIYWTIFLNAVILFMSNTENIQNGAHHD